MIFEDADSIQCYPNVELKHIDRLISVIFDIKLNTPLVVGDRRGDSVANMTHTR